MAYCAASLSIVLFLGARMSNEPVVYPIMPFTQPSGWGMQAIWVMSDITTYCVEYAVTNTSKCDACRKMIVKNSLRCATMYRSSKAVKKSAARYTWYHFKCWAVPELVTKLPLEQFRGYPQLKDQDKARVEQLVKAGVDSTWSSISKKDETNVQAAAPKTSADIDMTTKLTGAQLPSNKKRKQAQVTTETSNEKDSKSKDGIKQATDIAKAPGNKKVKKTKTPDDKKTKVQTTKAVNTTLTDSADQQELESITREIQELQKNRK